MTLYNKRQQLKRLKFAYNKLAHHLFNLRSKVSDLAEEVRQEELEIYIATIEGAITHIPEGQSNKKLTIPLTTKRTPPSSASAKKYLDYISTLSADSRMELLIALRDTQITSEPTPNLPEVCPDPDVYTKV